jgi:hypothetical protein
MDSPFRGNDAFQDGEELGGCGGVSRVLYNLFRAGARRPRNTVLCDGSIRHTCSEKIAAAFGEYIPIDGSCLVAHATGQVTQSKAQTCAIKVLGNSAGDDIFQLTDTRVLSSAKPEILPRRMTWADHLRDMHGKAFVHQQLTKWCLSSRFPVRVVALGSANELPHLTPAAGRGIANGVRELVGKPEGKQLGVKAKSLCVGVRNRCEVLKAGERDSAALDDQFTGVRRADAHHEDDVNIDVLFEQPRALLLGRACERNDVGTLEHLPKIGPIGKDSGANDVGEMGPIAVNDVILPIRLENSTVGLKVALVSGDSVGAIENGEKIGQQVDQHSAGSDLREALRDPSHVRERQLEAHWTRNDSGDPLAEQERGIWHTSFLGIVSAHQEQESWYDDASADRTALSHL